MTHILRKHGNVIMAVLGVFLMIAFSLPSYFSNRGDTSDEPAGTLNGKTITKSQIRSAEMDIKIIETLHLPLAQLISQRIIDSRDPNIHWYLLLQEAAKYGIVPAEADITEQIAQLGATDEQLTATLNNMGGLTQPELRIAVAHSLMIERLLTMAANTMQLSVPEMELAADHQFSSVQVNYTSLDGLQLSPSAKAFSDDQIKKQFDLYKSVLPASISGVAPATIDGHTYPFGYKYGDRVMVEYIKFEIGSLRTHFKPTKEDDEDAFRYYQDHRTDFKNPDFNGNTMAVSTQPAILPFEKVSDKLVDAQVTQRVNAFLKKVTENARDQASVPWKDAETEKGFRKGVMDNLVSYDQIVKVINSNPEYEGYQVVHGSHTGWLDKGGLKALEGIGQSTFSSQNATFDFADLALDVKELDPAANTMTRLYLQSGVEGPLLEDDAGNFYMYRVINTQKSHDPDSVAEVREQVIEDLKKVDVYQQKQARAKELAAAAATGDFMALATKQGLFPQKSAEMTRNNKGDPKMEPVPGFIDAAFSLVVPTTTTQPAKQPALPATTLDDDADLRVFVLAYDKYAPISPDNYAGQRLEMLGESRREAVYFAISWLGLDELAKRLNFVPTVPFSTTGAS